MNLKDDKTKVSIIALRVITSARVEVFERFEVYVWRCLEIITFASCLIN